MHLLSTSAAYNDHPDNPNNPNNSEHGHRHSNIDHRGARLACYVLGFPTVFMVMSEAGATKVISKLVEAKSDVNMVSISGNNPNNPFVTNNPSGG